MSERNTAFLLNDIKESIENIISFTHNLSFEMYCADIKTVHAVQHNFMIIGEAAARIEDEYKQRHTKINWRQVKDFRNVIVHDYFGIDNSIVWDIIQLNLSELSAEIDELLSNKKPEL
ncbi:MAG: DUF86 domain-containing protein [Bacteroidota bacterium]|nr:DUF86 domain-containing protein [Bacteroidota bacterium]